jgi:ubiquinone/menaquinone biosynthesis C-methylase UbiE
MNDDQTIEYYQKRAQEYEKIYFRDVPPRQAELKRLYELSRKVMAGKRVLDLACGTGFWTEFISEEAKLIVGVDINSGTLVEAQKKKYKNLTEFVLADFERLPFAGGSFDALLATFILSHVRRQDIGGLKDHLKTLIKPGSPVFLCDNNLITEIVPVLNWDGEHVNSYVNRKLENGEQYRILKNYYNRQELVDITSSWGKLETLIFETYYWGIVLYLD